MKKVVILGAIALLALGLSSCEDDKNKQWDSNAMVSLRAAQGVPSGAPTKAITHHLTAKEIVKQATGIMFWNRKIQEDYAIGRGFADTQRDTIENRLMMFGTDIIAYDGTYEPGFIEGEDAIIVIFEGEIITDTIAYISNRAMRAAQAIIKPAYDAGEYDLVYKTFDETFRFIPITGAEWRELKANGGLD